VDLKDIKAILDETFPSSAGPYQDTVATRLASYFKFLAPWHKLFRGSIIDVGGQYGNMLSVAERAFPELSDLTLTRYPVSGKERLVLRSRIVNILGFHCERDRLPSTDSSFDVVLFTEVLEHLLYDPVWTLMEINRVLRPGGILFLATPNAGSLGWIVRILKGENPAGSIEYKPRRVFERHNRIYTSREVLKLLAGLGFEIVAFSTMPSTKVKLLSSVLALTGASTRDFTVHAGLTTHVIARKVVHFDSLAPYPKETRWPSWLYSPRLELCVRPEEFIESEDDAFPEN
jgi:2-polyprenyl-3-methyl-5-hydroxy-6-metoxy-1,4-benzoquinol methylase